MSSSPDFKTALIESSIISDITDQETFGVLAGPALSTYTQFQAISASSSQIVFNVQIPSESIVLNREVYMTSQVAFTITGTCDQNQVFLNWGLTEALNAFPLQSLFSTIQAQINNVSTSTNLQDVLPMLLRMNDNRKLSRYNSMTPSYPDQQWGLYDQAVSTAVIPTNSNSNPLASYNNNGYDSDFQPRGSFPVRLIVEQYRGPNYVSDSLVCETDGNTFKVGVVFTCTEPFIALSPFLNSCPMNNAGLMGINNMSIVCNVDSSCKRLMGTAKTAVIDGVLQPSFITDITLGFTPRGGQAINAFTDTRLLFNFQTLQVEQMARLSSKNIVGYSDYPRFLTTFNSSTSIAAGGTSSLTSQNLQLNQVPSLILISVRIPMSNQNIANTSSFLQINNISINFNSQSGLLASATKYDLYQISTRNGSQQSYYEWGGAVNNVTDGAIGNVSNVATTGSLLVLNPALDFSLPSFLSGGSLGQFSFQFNINVTNQFNYPINPEICIITKNDGIFVTQQGTSVIYTAILDKQTVLRTKEQEAVLDWNHHQRLVGGKLSNMGLSALSKIVKYHKKNKHHSGNHHEHELGGASSGGVMSGGASSGGAHKGRHRLARHLLN
jgi:hypothetical protein